MKSLKLVILLLLLTPTALLAQDGIDIGNELLMLLQMLIPVIVGIVSSPLFGLIKKAVTAIDALPAAVQQVLVVVQAWALGLLSQVVGIGLPDALAGFTLDTTESLIAGIIALIYHEATK